jgi:hypothetical protein
MRTDIEGKATAPKKQGIEGIHARRSRRIAIIDIE